MRIRTTLVAAGLAAFAVPAVAHAEYRVEVVGATLEIEEKNIIETGPDDRLTVKVIETEDRELRYDVRVNGGNNLDVGRGCDPTPRFAAAFGTTCDRAASNQTLRVRFRSGNDTLDVEGIDPGSEFPDKVIAFGQDSADVLEGGARADSLNGGEGSDTIDGRGGDDVLRGDVQTDFQEANYGRDTIVGGAGDDLIKGGSSEDTLTGNTGRDHLFGGDAEDKLLDGNAASDGTDTYEGGPGRDSVDYGLRTTKIQTFPGGGMVSGAPGERDRLVGIQTFIGGSGNDELWGFPTIDDATDDVPQTFRGGPGNDTIIAGGGEDDVRGGDGDDILNAGWHPDRVRGEAGNDRLLMRDAYVDLLISCGENPGDDDYTRVDANDPTASGCEEVERP